MAISADKPRINNLCDRISGAYGTERVRQHLKDGRFQKSDEVHVKSWLFKKDLPGAFASITKWLFGFAATAAAVVACIKT